jgi:hypothetical protein
MGMFNYIKVEQDLPLNDELKALNIDFKQEEYQTKELEDNIMSTYIIRDYRLFQLKVDGHWEDNPSYVKGETKFSEFFNKNRWVEDSREEVFRDDYTGTFTFGTYVLGQDKESYDWFPDWKCVVVQGLLTEISLVKPVDRNSSKARLELDEQFKKQLDDHKTKMKCPVYSFYFKYYVRTFEKIEWKLYNIINRIISFLNWLQWKGIRKVIRILTPR